MRMPSHVEVMENIIITATYELKENLALEPDGFPTILLKKTKRSKAYGEDK